MTTMMVDQATQIRKTFNSVMLRVVLRELVHQVAAMPTKATLTSLRKKSKREGGNGSCSTTSISKSKTRSDHQIC